MFKDGDPAGSNALPARQARSKWREVVQNPTVTCFD
jgi:hypothetical protein